MMEVKSITNSKVQSRHLRPLLNIPATLLFFILVAILVYSNSFSVPFQFDDIKNIESNSAVTINAISELSVTEISKGPSGKRIVPLISFALNHIISSKDVWSYHLVNTILHALNAFLLYIFLSLTWRCVHSEHSLYSSLNLFPLIAATVWLIHPINTQSVVYIVQRMNIVGTFFYLLSFISYIYARTHSLTLKPEKSRKFLTLLYSLTLIFYCLALLSKENVALLPISLIFYEWYFFQNLSKSFLKRAVLLISLASALIFVIASIHFNRNPFQELASYYHGRNFTLEERLLTQLRVIPFYLSLLILPLPSRLNLDHYFSNSTSLFEPISTFYGGIVLVFCLFLLWKFRRKEPVISFAIVWFGINLLVESSFIALEMAFEHRLYLPSMLLCAAVPIVVSRFLESQRSFLLILCPYLLFLGICTYTRNFTWQTHLSLWADSYHKSPENPRTAYNLALMLKREGRELEAIDLLKSIKVSGTKTYKEIPYQLGYLQQKNGQLKDAEYSLEHAAKLDPENLDIKLLLQGVYLQTGEYHKAIQLLSILSGIKPNDVQIEGNLGSAYFRTEQYSQAILQFSKALAVEPQSQLLKQSLLISYIKADQLTDAERYAEQLLADSIHKGDSALWLGRLFNQYNLNELATKYLYLSANSLSDPYPAWLALTDHYRKTEQHNKVVEVLLKVSTLRPNDAKVLNDIGSAYAKQGNLKMAEFYVTKALEISPDLAAAKQNLAVINQLLSEK